jgi:tRNA(fMet)-specific endonuclease VapC
MFLIDTNCFIYYLNNSQAEFCDWFDSLDNSEIYVSSLVIFELLTGYYIKNNKKMINVIMQMTENFNVVNYDINDAVLSAKNKAELRQRGVQNDSMDIHIASQAINNKLTLVTFNHKDFKVIEGLKVKGFVFKNKNEDCN